MSIRIEILQHFDETNRSIVHRLPESGSTDVKVGAQLIVQQNQEAVFFRDGQPLDRFGPGRHTLSTANVPLLTRLLTIPWQESPFQAQVYFIGKQLFTDQKWGTRQPIAFRDREFGMIRLRGYGAYSFRVADAALLIHTLAGTQGRYTTDEVAAFLRDVIVSRLADLLGSVDISLLDMATHYEEIAAGARAKVAEDFERYGLELVDFFINGISAPDEVQRAIDARSAISAVGDLASYMKIQAARSMRELAARGGHELPSGFGLMMPGLIHHVAQGLVPPAFAADFAKPLPADALTFDDLAVVPTTRDVRELVRQVAGAAGYAIAETERGMHITLPINPLRQQRVEVTFDSTDEQGNALVTFSSVCGPLADPVKSNSVTSNPTESDVKRQRDVTLKLLEYNAQMVYGAFAVRDLGAGPMVLIQANQLADTADPLEISRLLSAIAWQADRAEEKLTGEDRH